MLFAIDIDGTIGFRNMGCFALRCNERFQLGMDEERLQSLSYADFLQQPELVAYREHLGETRFHHAIKWMDYDPHVLRAMVPLPEAIGGVSRLAALGTIAYYTARRTSDAFERENRAMQEATEQWLCQQHFPSPTNIVFCSGIQDKLMKLAERLQITPQPAVLIDDHPRLLEAYTHLDAPMQRTFRRHVTVVSFRSALLPEQDHGVRIFPLVSWRTVEPLLHIVQRDLMETKREGIAKGSPDKL